MPQPKAGAGAHVSREKANLFPCEQPGLQGSHPCPWCMVTASLLGLLPAIFGSHRRLPRHPCASPGAHRSWGPGGTRVLVVGEVSPQLSPRRPSARVQPIRRPLWLWAPVKCSMESMFLASECESGRHTGVRTICLEPDACLGLRRGTDLTRAAPLGVHAFCVSSPGFPGV